MESKMLSTHVVLFLGISIFLNYAEARLSGEGIIGGDLAQEGQFPYQVILELSNNAVLSCGGSIISEQHILTAAHCVLDKDGFFELALNVKVGITNGKQCTDRYLVERIYTSPKYTPRNSSGYFNATYDIAVLKLSDKLNLSPESGLQALKLPQARIINGKKSYSSFTGQKAILSGYGVNTVKLIKDENGKVKEEGTTDYQLRYAETRVITNEECGKMYSEGKINRAMLCAQIEKRDNLVRGACSADSGSPLVIDDTIIGVLVASPFGCNEATVPARYSRVGFYMDFIESAMNDRNLSKMRVAELSVQYALIDEM